MTDSQPYGFVVGMDAPGPLDYESTDPMLRQPDPHPFFRKKRSGEWCKWCGRRRSDAIHVPDARPRRSRYGA